MRASHTKYLSRQRFGRSQTTEGEGGPQEARRETAAEETGTASDLSKGRGSVEEVILYQLWLNFRLNKIALIYNSLIYLKHDLSFGLKFSVKILLNIKNMTEI